MSERDNLDMQLADMQDTLACYEADLEAAESDDEHDTIMSNIDELCCEIADCEEDIRYLEEEEAENDDGN